jgi:hypothetical protein
MSPFVHDDVWVSMGEPPCRVSSYSNTLPYTDTRLE